MNWNDGNIFFFTDFDDNMESNLIVPLTKEIQKQRRLRSGRLDFYINSFGGYAHLLFNIIELVEIAKREDIVVRTIVPNLAASAGSMLAIAGTPGERYIGRTAEHLVHYGTAGGVEETPKQVERTSAYKNRDFQHRIGLYRKYCDVPDLDSEMMDNGWFIPAPKCIKFKMADKYTDKLDIGDFE